MGTTKHIPTIKWYRSPVSREDLSCLNRRSDWKGALQTLGYLGTLGLTGTLAYLSAGRFHWAVVVLMFILHGTCYTFMVNGFHELIHDSVFKTRSLNKLFLGIFSFLGWHNHVMFWASHTEHHKYTLHPPADLEVVVPEALSLREFLGWTIVNVKGFYDVMKMNIRLSVGRLEGQWENALFPESDLQKRRRLFNWARILLVGHGTIVVVSLAFGLWLLPVVITLAPFYCACLHYLCNNAQHTGLQDNVADFRLCSRTIILSPLVRFLYWHMNYHTEHHMYAAVPCYNLGRLHKLIRHDMPRCPHGLFETWREISTILRRQKVEPDYRFIPDLPGSVVSLGRPPSPSPQPPVPSHPPATAMRE